MASPGCLTVSYQLTERLLAILVRNVGKPFTWEPPTIADAREPAR